MSGAEPRIVKLKPSDAERYAAVRGEMLRDRPHAFAASPEDEGALDPEFYRRMLASPEKEIFAALDENGDIVGTCGFVRMHWAKLRHRAEIWGVYVAPSARRRGLAARLLAEAEAHARSLGGVEVLELSVSAGKPNARSVYERAGFVAWGTKPDDARVDGTSYDEVYLQKRLTPR